MNRNRRRHCLLAAFGLHALSLASAWSFADETSAAPTASAPASQPASQPAINVPWRAGNDAAATSQPAADSAEATPSPRADGPRDPVARFRELSFDLGAEADWHRRSVKTDARSPSFNHYGQTNTAQRIEETAGLKGSGDLISDRFARFNFDVRGGFAQERYHESIGGIESQDSPDGSTLQYDGRATFFPAGKVTANIYASKLDDRVPRMFLPSLERERERYGTELLFNDPTLPMRLNYEDSFEKLRSFTHSGEDDEQRGDRRLDYEATWLQSEQHQTRFTYQYDDSRERYSGTEGRFDKVRNYLTLNDTFKFGPEDRSQLDLLARYQDESGDVARDVTEFAPRLRLQHTDSISSTYRAQFLKETYQGIEVRHYRGDVGLQHQAGDWLSSSAEGYGVTDQPEDGGDTTEWGGVLTSAFNRENDLGRFSAIVTYNHAWQRADAMTGNGVVLNESVTLRDPLPAILAHTDVRRFSILVTDSESKRPYLLGRDYDVFTAGRYASIRRVPTGRITDGQTVLVSYLYRVAQGLELSRDRGDLRIQQAFKNGWTPYYAASYQAEDIDRTRFISYDPRDVNRHRIGADYRQPRWSVGGEYEYNDDSVDPYQAVHLRGDSTFYQKAPHELSTRGTFSFFHFSGAGRYLDEHDVSLLDVGLAYRYQLDAKLEGNAAAAYRFEHDSLDGTTHGVDLSGSLNYKIGQFTAILEVEYNQLNLPDSHDSGFSAWVKLRRDFPLIGARD